MAGPRLRKAFRYPSDSDSDGPVEMDEEEQEKLIDRLHIEDESKTAFYTKAFLALPLLSLLLYIPSIFSAQTFLPSLTAVTSLLSTAYILYYVPVRLPQPAPSGPRRVKVRLDIVAEGEGPLRRYIVPLNGALCAVLALGSWVVGSGGKGLMGGGEREGILGYLPAGVFFLIMTAKMQLRPVDVGQLEKLRYRYKGA